MLTMKQARRMHKRAQTYVHTIDVLNTDGEVYGTIRTRQSRMPFRKWFRSVAHIDFSGATLSPKLASVLFTVGGAR